jgi:hypothetical protein
MHGGMKNANKSLVEELEGKRPLGRHKHSWEANIKMDLRKIGWEFVDWIYGAQDWW